MLYHKLTFRDIHGLQLTKIIGGGQWSGVMEYPASARERGIRGGGGINLSKQHFNRLLKHAFKVKL